MAPDPRPNLLLILVDTLRPDVLGSYGGDPGVAPTLDSLARCGLRFEDLISQSPWTRPAVGSLFSSRYPTELGIDHGGHNGVMQALPEEVGTLPQALADAGYAVAALQSNPHLKTWTRFDRGFESYEFIAEERRGELRARALEMLRSLAHGDRPFFFYLHLMEPHLPYLAHADLPPPTPEPPPPTSFAPPIVRRQLLTSPDLPQPLRAHIRHLYATDIRFADAWLAELMRALRSTGEARQTMILVVSDHGEEHWDHGATEHGHTLHRELLWVPGILVPPSHGGGAQMTELRRARAARDDGTIPGGARILDLAPTLLELLDAPPLPGARGISLVEGMISGRAPPWHRPSPRPCSTGIRTAR